MYSGRYDNAQYVTAISLDVVCRRRYHVYRRPGSGKAEVTWRHVILDLILYCALPMQDTQQRDEKETIPE
jgi:hypothetical protein